MHSYAGLSKKQIVLYQNTVHELTKRLETVEGVQRRGIILASLMKFKQLCNHPDQFLGTGGYEEADSGKFLRLREICETIYEKREKVLVFTQFKEITRAFARIFKNDIRTRRTGTARQHRRWNEEKYCGTISGQRVYSLHGAIAKSGGVGLNLTEANHVIHFDRWWNPAVENQATDRAFRIGQKKTLSCINS